MWGVKAKLIGDDWDNDVWTEKVKPIKLGTWMIYYIVHTG